MSNRMANLNFRVPQSLLERVEDTEAMLLKQHSLEISRSELYRAAINTFLHACEEIGGRKRIYDLSDIQLAIIEAIKSQETEE
ncbi:hypothetical protein O4H49_20080 [Kiloniella laminariae]|uniref:Ribbon-helix-helix protein CopG domain-containing protein n=1 Tax=Kiloniella laminariae TaxID=454162 RepID=A0ABT4LPT6_9PROT|nr:hypothetical protein [Kiloniella laminariae]MCZ4283094.1 hypothetical protein [Kiloniella laminariae]